MIQDRNAVVQPYAFLLSIELQDASLAVAVQNAIIDSVRFMEGTGETEVEFLGKLDVYEEPTGGD